MAMSALRNGKLFLRIAGVSGASAVGFGTYGAHVLRPKAGLEHEKLTFETANRYQFFHTLGLVAAPLCRKPMLVGGLMSTGMVLFCVPMYYYAMTSDPTPVKIAPYGGTLLILAWLAMVL